MNRLADETSPYLQQHAHNPVDWYPWGDEALTKAREEGKPIFLSIGYSACHWCHVMERESFENEEIAAYLNEHFVNIKVDREERPDIDNIYMEAVQVMTGHGGWPMSVFLRPDDLAPFFAGTYFPPEDRWQRPGFKSVLEQLVDVWENDPDRVEKVTGQVTDRLELMASTMTGDNVTLDLLPIDGAMRHLDMTFDAEWGGFGEQPKFPPSMQLRLLLHVWADEDRDEETRDRAIDIVEQTLVQMASGGMYDQIGGGFHRYSVDRKWLVPHFEKMLYDNALLTMAYTEGFQATGRTLYERVVRQTMEYLQREMVSDDGAFYSTQDADSEGEEGKFFVWTPEELAEVLSPGEAERAAEYWGIEPGGNFEGKSIPNRLHAVADDWTLGFEEMPDDIGPIRQKLFAARQERVAPGTDTKIIAAWNGLMISAMARAGAVFDEPSWIETAADAARFVLDEMRDADGLYRTHKDGRARFPGYLDDYANMAAGLFDLFEATADVAWLERSEKLMEQAQALFWDDDGSAFFYTADHHTDLLVRQKESYDGAVPASNSIAVMTLLRLSVATGRNRLRDRAHLTLQSFYTQMKKMPRSLSEMMQALDFHVSGPNEIVCFTPEGEESLARDAWLEYRPNAVIFDVSDNDYAEKVPVARERGVVDGAPTVYVCSDGVCELPRHEL
jgi:uncharacterized protein YyaL (SSP411 family)